MRVKVDEDLPKAIVRSLRPDEDGIRPVLAFLERVLGEHSLDALNATITVATPRGIRIRRA